MPIESRDWCFYIGDNGSDYRVAPNVYGGGGACLLVRRGIMCEYHVQVFSQHSSSCFPEDIEKVIKQYGKEYKDSIENMINFINSLPEKRGDYLGNFKYSYGPDWQTMENIANTFFQSLIKNIIERAEDINLEGERKSLEENSLKNDISSSPMFCEHANENPNICKCPPNCYCKKYTCKNRKN